LAGKILVNYGRIVGFREHLGFFEFCCELALANHANFFENKCAPIFYENVRFLGKTQNFRAQCERFSHDPKKISLCSKDLEGFKYVKK
jgi:hypothetical protein